MYSPNFSRKWESFFNHRSICNQTSDKTWWWYIKLSCFLKSFLYKWGPKLSSFQNLVNKNIMHYIVCSLSLLKVHSSCIFLRKKLYRKKNQVFFREPEKNLTWNFKFRSGQVLLQQVQVRSSSSSAWPGTSSQVKFEHFQVFWTL